MSTCSLQINIQIDFQLVKMCTFSSLSFCLGWGHITSGLSCVTWCGCGFFFRSYVNSYRWWSFGCTSPTQFRWRYWPGGWVCCPSQEKRWRDWGIKAQAKAKVITAPSNTADKGTLGPHVVIEIDPSEYTTVLASKTREMVISIENPDPNLEIKIDQRRPVVRTKEGAHLLLFLLLFGFHCLFSQSGRGWTNWNSSDMVQSCITVAVWKQYHTLPNRSWTTTEDICACSLFRNKSRLNQRSLSEMMTYKRNCLLRQILKVKAKKKEGSERHWWSRCCQENVR